MPLCKCWASLTLPNVPVPKVVEISKSLSLYLVSSLGRGKGNRSWVGFTGEGMLSAGSSTSTLDADDRLVGDALMIPYLIGSYMPKESNCLIQICCTMIAIRSICRLYRPRAWKSQQQAITIIISSPHLTLLLLLQYLLLNNTITSSSNLFLYLVSL